MCLVTSFNLICLCRYAKALDAAVQTRRINVVVSVIDDLTGREGLQSAIQHRSTDTLVPLVKFLIKYIAHPQYAKVVMSTVGLCVDLHTTLFVSDPELVEILKELRSRVIAEIRLQRKLKELSGVLEMLTAV
jgi:U3 small nucleolar RNA-associated protein 15